MGSALRVGVLDWRAVTKELDTEGCAVIEKLLAPEECDALAGLYPEEGVFRSRVVMARHGFGRGEYKYFKYPLPGIIAELRTLRYPRLVPLANRWNEARALMCVTRCTATSSCAAMRRASYVLLR